jgi:hypothetical protein
MYIHVIYIYMNVYIHTILCMVYRYVCFHISSVHYKKLFKGVKKLFHNYQVCQRIKKILTSVQGSTAINFKSVDT